MMSTVRMAVIGAGTAGVAGVAIFTQPAPVERTDEGRTTAASEICLKGDLALFEGVTARCYSPSERRALLDRPVVNRQGERVTLTLAHPTDSSISSVECGTCRVYREKSFDGWYAMSSRDMRREGYFERACGALAALADAQPADKSFFANGAPDEAEVAALALTIRFAELTTSADELLVEKASGNVWRITAGAYRLQLHEIANADFDNDGVEEILAFTAGAPAEGTAAFYDLGLLEKDSADAALAFTPLSYGRDRASGAAG